MRELLSYDKFAGDETRILILQSQYWLDSACIHAARDLGWTLATVPVPLEGVLPRASLEELLRTLGEFKPDFILSVNLSGMDVDGLFAGLFEDLQIPYVTWFVDDPRTIIMGNSAFASAYSVALTWDAAYVDYLGSVGFPAVHHLPLAVDPHVFNAEPADTWVFPPTFVGNSMISFAEREWAWLEDHAKLADAVRHAFDEGSVTRERFGQGLDAMLEGGLLERLDADQKRHAELLMFVEGTRRLRRELVEALAPDGLEVRGDEEWRRVVPGARGAVNYVEDLPGFYRLCEVNLNVTSIQMPSTVNQRVFDCPAAGGFLLTDAQAELGELFDLEQETACYASIDECRDLLKFYRGHSEARRRIASNARRRILSEHTYAHRLRALEAIVKERFGC